MERREKEKEREKARLRESEREMEGRRERYIFGIEKNDFHSCKPFLYKYIFIIYFPYWHRPIVIKLCFIRRDGLCCSVI